MILFLIKEQILTAKGNYCLIDLSIKKNNYTPSIGNLMKQLLILIIGLSIAIFSYGKERNLDSKITTKDSILLNRFWSEFNSAINSNDKIKLSALCKFPFYCHPCNKNKSLKLLFKILYNSFSKS